MSTPRLFYDRRGRPFLEDTGGVWWRLKEENEALEFVSEAGERRRALVPEAWEHLSAEELEQYRRAARRLSG